MCWEYIVNVVLGMCYMLGICGEREGNGRGTGGGVEGRLPQERVIRYKVQDTRYM
jgi:hypothetical protein